jgi:hypothetical protein
MAVGSKTRLTYNIGTILDVRSISHRMIYKRRNTSILPTDLEDNQINQINDFPGNQSICPLIKKRYN